MEIGFLKGGLDLARQRKKWIILLGMVGFSSYGAYKVYHLPFVARKRERIVKLVVALVSVAELVSDSAEAITMVSRDLREFLKSDSDEVPNSLKQLSKIARSEEFSKSVISVSRATMIGILRDYKLESLRNEIQESGNSSFADRVMDKVMSKSGKGFVSVVVGSFARNLILGFYANGDSDEAARESTHMGVSSVETSSSTLPRWLDVALDNNCRELVVDCINTFVSTAVTIYLDKAMDINFYDELFSGLTNPKHEDKVKDILVSLCNGAVETLARTSHQVLTTSKSGPGFKYNTYSAIDPNRDCGVENKTIPETEACLRQAKDMNGPTDLQSSAWVSSVSSTLAVPSNRKFVLDVTGRVTFETVRSLIDFLSSKILEGFKRSFGAVHNEVVGRGFEVVRYVSAKSCVILTVCLALFLHMLGNTRLLLPS